MIYDQLATSDPVTGRQNGAPMVGVIMGLTFVLDKSLDAGIRPTPSEEDVHPIITLTPGWLHYDDPGMAPYWWPLTDSLRKVQEGVKTWPFLGQLPTLTRLAMAAYLLLMKVLQ
jgi:hypothetical protein